MEPSTEQSVTPPKKSSSKIIIAIVVLLIVAIVAAAAVIITLNQKDDNSPKIGYAADAKVMLDENSLQAAINEAMKNAEEGRIGLKYRNDAYSTDGINFECVIANSSSNIFDMYLNIYADAEFTDQIFLSELVPPGSGFDHITLEHALEVGDHTVYVVLTQVDTDENGEQVIKNQVRHTMDFHVTES